MKKENKFLKIAKKQGKIKEIEEAFIEYPVEDEIHEGKIEKVIAIREDSIEYSYYNIGDIVFVSRYKYLDGKSGNNHLFVIIEQNNIAVPIENFGMLISSKIEKSKYKSNKIIKSNKKNNLQVDSIVKTDVIYKIPNDQILLKIGSIDIDEVNEYKEIFYKND